MCFDECHRRPRCWVVQTARPVVAVLVLLAIPDDATALQCDSPPLPGTSYRLTTVDETPDDDDFGIHTGGSGLDLSEHPLPTTGQLSHRAVEALYAIGYGRDRTIVRDELHFPFSVPAQGDYTIRIRLNASASLVLFSGGIANVDTASVLSKLRLRVIGAPAPTREGVLVHYQDSPVDHISDALLEILSHLVDDIIGHQINLFQLSEFISQLSLTPVETFPQTELVYEIPAYGLTPGSVYELVAELRSDMIAQATGLFAGEGIEVTADLQINEVCVNPSTTPAALPGTHFLLSSVQWDDNGGPGDGDGIVEDGENPEIRVRLCNPSGPQVTNVEAQMSTTLQGADIWDSDVYFDDFSPAQCRWSIGGFNVHLNLGLAGCSGLLTNFLVRVTYRIGAQDFLQDFMLSRSVYPEGCFEAEFDVASTHIDDAPSIRPYNNGNALVESGEIVRLRPRLCNVGGALATDVDVRLASDDAVIEIPPSDWERYPDLQPGGCADLDPDDSFQVEVIDRGFEGPISFDLHIVTDQNPGEQIMPNAFSLTVHPAAWLSVPDNHDFGVAAPGTHVTFDTYIGNHGTADLHVSNIVGKKCDGAAASDVSITPTSFTIAPGGTRLVSVTFDTTEAIGQICRHITVQSDGRVTDAGVDDTLFLTGLVANSVAVQEILAAVGVEDPDIGGPIIVWQDRRNGNPDIYAFDARTRQGFPICTHPGEQIDPFASTALVAWEDRRNGSSNDDIYAHDLATGTEYPVTTSPLQEALIGVDGNRIAVLRLTGSVPDPCFSEVWNLVVFEYQGSGRFQQIYTSSYTNPTYSSSRSDFGEGLLVLRKVCNAGWDMLDFEAGGTLFQPAISYSSPPFAASAHRFVFQRGGPGSDDERISMWRTNGQVEDVVPRLDFGNEDYCNPADEVVAVGGPEGSDIIVYDYDCNLGTPPRSQGLYYWDRATGSEGPLTLDGSVPWLRMDGYGVVWLEYPGPHLKYAYFKQPELAVASADIASSANTPVEGAAFDVAVTVRNVSDVATGEIVVVRLYFGDPELGGKQEGAEQFIAPGLAGHGQAAVSFLGLVAPTVTEGDSEGLSLCVIVTTVEIEEPANNETCSIITVQDDDVGAPVFELVSISEHLGNGDGVVSDTELCRIAWLATDPSGIALQELWLDGNPIDLAHESAAFVGPLAAGAHSARIRVTDGDATPEAREVTEQFVVDACPNDPDKIEPGVCGCGVADTDCVTCPNGTCDAMENDCNCPQDCGPVCGDGCCTGTESCATCPEDCTGGCNSNGDCDDGVFCNGAELCTDGCCDDGPSPCPPQPCQTVSCNEVSGCVYSPIPCCGSPDPCCGSPDPCCGSTDPCCRGGCCTSDEQCQDALFCNGSEECIAGECESGTRPCGSGQTCNEVLDRCEATPFTLTFSSRPRTGGTVTVNPAPGSDGKYQAGSIVTLTASPANGFRFATWSGDSNGSANPVEVTMNANKSIVAEYEEVPPPPCPNGVCGEGEDSCNCPQDCGTVECCEDRDCDDGDAATEDRCDLSTCTHTLGDPETQCLPGSDGQSCNDNNACTQDDVCDDGVCAGIPITCEDDGEFCTGPETCVDDECVSEGSPCQDDEVCNERLDRCDPPCVPNNSWCAAFGGTCLILLPLGMVSWKLARVRRRVGEGKLDCLLP